MFPPPCRTDAIRWQGPPARHQDRQDAPMEARVDPPMDRGGWPPMIQPSDAWAFGRVLCDQPLNGELAAMAEPWKAMAAHLAALPVADRQIHLQAMLAARPDRDELVKALADVDPLGPPPQVRAVRF